MSYKGYKKTFEGGATASLAIMALVDAELLNWLSFQILPVVAGGSVNIDFTLEESNDGSNWIATSVTKNYNSAGSKNDMLAVSQASSRYYRLKPTITAGTISSYAVHAIGKG